MAVLILSLLLSASWGCHRKAPTKPAIPAKIAPKPPSDTIPQAITPEAEPTLVPEPPEPTPVPETAVAPNNCEVGEASFRERDYVKAILSYEDCLKTNSKSLNGDSALFYLGLSLALSNNSVRNMRRSEQVLQRLIREFPKSSYRAPAEFILALQSQIESMESEKKVNEAKIKQLSEELQKLKDIDMQRRSSSPP